MSKPKRPRKQKPKRKTPRIAKHSRKTAKPRARAAKKPRAKVAGSKKGGRRPVKSGRARAGRRPVLNVERSLLSKRDPHRKAPYAGGRNFPTTVERELGASPAAKKTATCREARKHLRLTQDEFARLIGVNHSSVENWESGRRGTEPKAFYQAMFGAFVGSQAPAGPREIGKSLDTVGPLRTCFELMRSAFDGPRLRSATIAPHEARRAKQLELVRQSNAECEAARAADPEGAAAVDAAAVVYKR